MNMCKLEFQEKTIEVSEGKKLYCILENECYVAKRKAQDIFIKDYKKCSNLKNLIDQYFTIVYKMEDDVEDIIYDLVEKHTGLIWVIDDSTAKKLSDYTYNLFKPTWTKIMTKRAELIGRKEDMQDYRRVRRDIQENDLSGWTLHTARNAIGNAGTSISTSMAEADLFNDKSIQSQLLELVGKVYFAYQNAMYDYLERNEKVEFEKIGREGFLKAKKFLEKAKAYPVYSSDNINFLKEAIEHSPDIREIYEYMIENYGDSDCEIEKFALKFMIDISSWKSDKAKDVLDGNRVTDLSSESKILVAIEAAEEHCKYFGVQPDKFDYVKGLRQTWKKIDKILRTVEGVEYPSREESDAVKADISYLESYSIENDMLLPAKIDKEKEQIIPNLKSGTVKETLDNRLLKLQFYQDILNIQTASMEIIRNMPVYEKNQKNFLFGHIFSQKKNFERFREVLADNEKVAFVYDTAWMNKGKNGLLLTNENLYYYTDKDIFAISLDEFAGIEVVQEKIKLHKREAEDICTDLKLNVDQLEYVLFCEAFTHVVMMCRAIKNGNLKVSDEKVYDNYKEKNANFCLANKKKIMIPIVVIMLLVVLLVFKPFSKKQVAQEVELPEETAETSMSTKDNEERVEINDNLVEENNNEIVEAVKNSSLSGYAGEITYNEAFAEFFDNPQWSVKKNESGIVNTVFTGTCWFQEQLAEVEIIFEYNSFTNEASVFGFSIDDEAYSVDYWNDLQQAIFLQYEEPLAPMQEEESGEDYTSWINTYLRTKGPAATISIWEANQTGIQFAVSIGVSGAAAYIDMRDMHAEWIDQNTVVYTDGTGYQLTLVMQLDGSLAVYEKQEYYEGGLSLTGTYTREAESDLSVCEFVFPNSAESLLTIDDCAGLTELECKIARNEIYARYGRKFNDESLQAYFDGCSWYHGVIEPENFTENILNEVELANLQTVIEYESIMEYRD